MICKNCSYENAPEDIVCKNCGTPLNDEALELEENEIVDVAEESEIVEEEAVEDVISDNEIADSEVVDEIIENEVVEQKIVDYNEQVTKKKVKLVSFSGLIALIIIAIVLWIAFTGIFAPKYDIPVDRSNFAISYIKDFSIYQKSVFGDPVMVSDSLTQDTSVPFTSHSQTTIQSKDGKIIYFLENYDYATYSGSLYVSYNGKDKIHIADNVLQGFSISENGKTVVYGTDLDVSTFTCKLYYYTKGIEPQLIANQSLYQSSMVSENGKAIAFFENVNPETRLGELYTVKIGKTPLKIDDEVVMGVKISDNGEALYLKNLNETNYTFELYKARASKAPKLISNNILSDYIMASSFSNKLGLITADENNNFNFSINSNNKSKPIMDDLMGFFTIDIENENFLLAKTPEDSTSPTGSPNMYLKKKGKDAVEIAQELMTAQHAAASNDFKTIYYIDGFDQTTSKGNLHIRKETLFGGGKDKVIAEGVTYFTASRDGKVVIYMTDVDLSTGTGNLYSYTNGKTKLLGEGVFTSGYKLSPSGKKVVYVNNIDTQTYTGNLCVVSTTGNSKANIIDAGAYASFYLRGDKSLLYIKNINNETSTHDLYMWKGSGSPSVVDTNISTILFE